MSDETFPSIGVAMTIRSLESNRIHFELLCDTNSNYLLYAVASFRLFRIVVPRTNVQDTATKRVCRSQIATPFHAANHAAGASCTGHEMYANRISMKKGVSVARTGGGPAESPLNALSTIRGRLRDESIADYRKPRMDVRQRL